jgi:hypothetical protein
MNDYKCLVSSPEVKELERKDRRNRIITTTICIVFFLACSVLFIDRFLGPSL